MPRTKKKVKEPLNRNLLFSNKELAAWLNNAVIASLAPPTGKIPEKRMRHLKPYVLGIIAPLFEHVAEEAIRPEELVAVLTTAARFTHNVLILKTDAYKAVDVVPTMEDEDVS